jgi:hypothetical protein
MRGREDIIFKILKNNSPGDGQTDRQTEYGQNVPARTILLTLLVQKQKKRFPT